MPKKTDSTSRRSEKSTPGAPSEALRAAIFAFPGSLAELARQSGVDVAALSRFQRGRCELMTKSIDRLAVVLKLELRPAPGKAKDKTKGR